MGKPTTTQVDATPEQKLVEITKEVKSVQVQASKIKISDAKGLSQASEFLAGVKARIDKVEKLRTFFTKPLVDQKRNIDALFKAQSDPLTTVFNSVKRAVSDYTLEEDRKARIEEERLAKLQEKKNERRADAGKPIDFTPAPIVERAAPTTYTDAGKTTTKKVWKFEVINPNLVPREFCVVEDKLVREAVKNGVREIAGVRIYEDVDVSVSALK